MSHVKVFAIPPAIAIVIMEGQKVFWKSEEVVGAGGTEFSQTDEFVSH